MHAVLIVDDDPGTAAALSHALATDDRLVETAGSVQDALERVRARHYDVAVARLVSTTPSDLDLVPRLKTAQPDLRVVLIRAGSSLDVAVEAMRAGAFDVIPAPFDDVAVKAAVDRAIAPHLARSGTPPGPSAPSLVGRSPAMTQLYRQIAQAAVASAPVLILGESGVGKGLVARALHDQGPRQSGPFLSVNCAAIADPVFASALFGRVRDPHAEAARERGLFEQAQGGTLFLDEIGELSPAMQAQLLRVLEARQVRPLGSDNAVPVDARVIASTNIDIDGAIAAQRFRQDLFYRLAVFLIRVPPLRDRRQDIPLLVDQFSRAAALRAGRAVSLSPGAIARLRQLDWPGNVRELENVVERLVASARSSVIEAADVTVDPTASTPAGAHPFADMPTLDELERRYLVYALQRFKGNRTRTAAALGIDRRTLYRMSARLGVPITGADIHGERP